MLQGGATLSHLEKKSFPLLVRVYLSKPSAPGSYVFSRSIFGSLFSLPSDCTQYSGNEYGMFSLIHFFYMFFHLIFEVLHHKKAIECNDKC